MTTSVMTVSAQNIVDDALYQAGKKDVGNPAETELVEIALRMGNGMIKQWQSRGVQLHTVTDLSVPQHSSNQSYTIKLATGDVLYDRPMRVISARRKDNTSLYETPIDVIPIEEYNAITIKSVVAPVQQVAYKKEAAQGTLYVWPISDALLASPDYTVILSIQRPVNIFETGATVPDFPSEMYLALVFGLADLMSKGKNKEIADKAQGYFNQLLMTDQENSSIFWQPETR